LLILVPIAAVVYFCWDKVKEQFIGGGNINVEDRGKTFQVSDGNQTYNLSKTCPHAGCDVDYSAQDGKFICPCHGSEFNIKGEVIQGPAKQNLEKI
jgi:Rieske Fe-S protein